MTIIIMIIGEVLLHELDLCGDILINMICLFINMLRIHVEQKQTKWQLSFFFSFFFSPLFSSRLLFLAFLLFVFRFIEIICSKPASIPSYDLANSSCSSVSEPQGRAAAGNRMSPWVVVFLLIAGSWLVLLMTLGFAERMVDRRVRESLEVRQWAETVRAMRRMAQEESDL